MTFLLLDFLPQLSFSIACVVVGLLWFVWGARALRNLQEIDVSSEKLLSLLKSKYNLYLSTHRWKSGEWWKSQTRKHLRNLRHRRSSSISTASEKSDEKASEKSKKFKYFYGFWSGIRKQMRMKYCWLLLTIFLFLQSSGFLEDIYIWRLSTFFLLFNYSCDAEKSNQVQLHPFPFT